MIKINRNIAIACIFAAITIFATVTLSSCSAGSKYAVPTNESAPQWTQSAVEATQSALEVQSSEAKLQAQEADAQRTQIAADLAKERRQMTEVVLHVTQTVEAQKISATQAAIARIVQATEHASAQSTQWAQQVYANNLEATQISARKTETIIDNRATATAQWQATQDSLFVASQKSINDAMIAEAQAEEKRIQLTLERQRAVNDIMAYFPIIISVVILVFLGILLWQYMNRSTKLITDQDGNLTGIVQINGDQLRLVQPGRAVQPVVIVDHGRVKSPRLSDGISQLATTQRDQALQAIKSMGNAENVLPSGVAGTYVKEMSNQTPQLPQSFDNNNGITVVDANSIKAWLKDINHQIAGEVIDAEVNYLDDGGDD